MAIEAPSGIFLPFNIQHAYDYEAFVQLTARMVQENTTTGPVKSESRISATKLNLQRLNRITKTMHLLPEWDTIDTSKTSRLSFFVISETWCGDGAQIVPALHKIAQKLGIDMRIILRDEYPDIADQYLFRGTRSIPILVVFDQVTGKQLGVWGPKPKEAQQIVDDAKRDGIPHDDYVITLQNWYNHNKTISLQHELFAFLRDLL